MIKKIQLLQFKFTIIHSQNSEGHTMKRQLLASIVLVTLSLSLPSCNSTNEPTETPMAPTELLGSWYHTDTSWPNTDTLFFQRKDSMNIYDWGQRIEVKKDGNFIDEYTARCGNDENIHYTEGKWSYDENTKIFGASIQICLREKRYKIVSLSSSNLILVKP